MSTTMMEILFDPIFLMALAIIILMARDLYELATDAIELIIEMFYQLGMAVIMLDDYLSVVITRWVNKRAIDRESPPPKS